MELSSFVLFCFSRRPCLLFYHQKSIKTALWHMHHVLYLDWWGTGSVQSRRDVQHPSGLVWIQFTENGLVLQARETIKSQSCPHTPAQVKQQTDGGHSNNRPLFLVLIMGKQDTKTSTLIYRLPNHCIQFPETEI